MNYSLDFERELFNHYRRNEELAQLHRMYIRHANSDKKLAEDIHKAIISIEARGKDEH